MAACECNITMMFGKHSRRIQEQMLKMRIGGVGGIEVCALVTIKVTVFKDVMLYFLVGGRSLLLTFCDVDGGNAFA
jgi:hypothetical protein